MGRGAGRQMRGHEFHFAEIVESGAAQPLWSLCDADNQVLGDAGHAVGTVAGSFFHAIDLRHRLINFAIRSTSCQTPDRSSRDPLPDNPAANGGEPAA